MQANAVLRLGFFVGLPKKGKTKQDASKTRRCEHPDGSVQVVRELGARNSNAVLRRIFFVCKTTERDAGSRKTRVLPAGSLLVRKRPRTGSVFVMKMRPYTWFYGLKPLPP